MGTRIGQRSLSGGRDKGCGGNADGITWDRRLAALPEDSVDQSLP